MKYTAILLASCVPLVALTASSIVQAVLSASSTADNMSISSSRDDADRIRQSQDFARKSEESVLNDTPMVQQLGEMSFWDVQVNEPSAASSEELKAVGSALRESAQTRKLVDSFCPIAERLAKLWPSHEADSLEKQCQAAAEAQAALKAFYDANRAGYVNSVKGASALFEVLERRAGEIGKEKELLELRISIARVLLEAHRAQEDSQFQRCLDLLDRHPLNKAVDASTIAELKELRVRAEYGRDRSLLWERAKSAHDRVLLAEADKFLGKYPKAPSATDDAKHADLQRWRDELEVDVQISELENLSQFEQLLNRAVAVVQHKAAQTSHKEQVKRKVVNWLMKNGFPRLEPPTELIGRQEAWTKNGQRLLGYFDLPAGVEQWRFWRDVRAFSARQPALGDMQIPKGSFSEDPAVPKYVQWATEYNTETARLVEQAGSKEQWQRFVQWCDQTDKLLIEYRNQRGVGVESNPDRACAYWTFRDQAALARRIIGQWDQFQIVMSSKEAER